MAINREQKREETHRRVFEAALEVFRRDGVSACRIDDIVRLAGVSRGTFYFHFPTKEDVLIAYLHKTEREIIAALDEVPEDAGLPEVLARLIDAMAAVWQPDPRLLPEVATVALRNAAAALVDSEADSLRDTMAQRFRGASARGQLTGLLPPELLSDLCLGHLLAGLLTWYGSPAAPLRTMLQTVMVLFFNGAGKSAA